MSMWMMSSWCRYVVGTCCLLAMTACGAVTEPPFVSPRGHDAEIVEIELAHVVYFETDDATLEPAEADALRRFARLVDERLSIGQIVIGHADTRADDAHNDALSQRRAARVAQALQDEGLAADRISMHAMGRRLPVAAADEATGWRLSRRVDVLARGLLVIEPRCPDWSRPTISHDAALPSSNFGCATALNFVRMLADPRDLLHPGPLAAADGRREAAAIGRYRTDTVRSLQVESLGQ